MRPIKRSGERALAGIPRRASGQEEADMKPVNASHGKRNRQRLASIATAGPVSIGADFGPRRQEKCESPAWGNGAFFGGEDWGESSSIGRSGPEKVQDKRAGGWAVTGHQPVWVIEICCGFVSRIAAIARSHRLRTHPAGFSIERYSRQRRARGK